MIKIAGMQLKVVRVHRDARVLELDDYFYALALRPCAEIEQWMFIQAQLVQYPLQPMVFRNRHCKIVEQDASRDIEESQSTALEPLRGAGVVDPELAKLDRKKECGLLVAPYLAAYLFHFTNSTMAGRMGLCTVVLLTAIRHFFLE